MERIAIDMDGVIADVAEQFFRYDAKGFRQKKIHGRSGRYKRT